MSNDTHALLREWLVLWHAYELLADHVRIRGREDVHTMDPRDVAVRVGAMGDRAAALLFAHSQGDTYTDSRLLLGELLAMLEDGRRPRSARELGLTSALLRGTKAA